MNFKANLKSNVNISICIAGIFLAMILLLNFVFDLFKVWAWSIQMFLIIYAYGIYKIKNFVVNIFFILIVPPLLFALENGAYIITPMQTFFEYFLVFYVFSLLFISRYISSLFLKRKNYLIIDSVIFIISFMLLIIIKYFLHSFASWIWWDTKHFWPALVYNAPWLATNCLTFPVIIIITIPVFKLFNNLYIQQTNKW